MNAWQAAFVEWNAQRRGVSADAMQDRFLASMKALDSGAGMHEALAVFADDSPAEVFDAYRIHALPHFLRMLSYPECAMEWPADHPIAKAFSGRPVSILDFGCGLAQFSITLSGALNEQGSMVSLFLADIPTLRADFLVWFTGAVFLPCTKERPIPPLPYVDVVVATEIFEHLHDPLAAFEKLDAALLPGGFLVTAVADHAKQFLHVSPDLSKVREALASYEQIEPNRLYRKP